MLRHRDCQSYHCFYMIFGGDARVFGYFFFGSCLVVGRSNLNLVKGSNFTIGTLSCVWHPMDVSCVCNDLLYRKNFPFRGNLSEGCLRAWDRVLSGGAKKLPGQYTGRGEDLTPSLALGEHHKPQTGMCGDAHRGARCGEK